MEINQEEKARATVIGVRREIIKAMYASNGRLREKEDIVKNLRATFLAVDDWPCTIAVCMLYTPAGERSRLRDFVEWVKHPDIRDPEQLRHLELSICRSFVWTCRESASLDSEFPVNSNLCMLLRHGIIHLDPLLDQMSRAATGESRNPADLAMALYEVLYFIFTYEKKKIVVHYSKVFELVNGLSKLIAEDEKAMQGLGPEACQLANDLLMEHYSP